MFHVLDNNPESQYVHVLIPYGVGTLKLFRPGREERKEEERREGGSNVRLMQHGAHIELKKLWAKSLLGWMDYRKIRIISTHTK